MNHQQQYKSDSLVRARDFLDAQAADVAALATSDARHQLDEALRQASV